MDDSFGGISTLTSNNYNDPQTNYHNISDVPKLHQLVCDSSCPNYIETRIPVESNLNIKMK